MYVVSKVVLEYIPPFALLSLRLLLGFAALALIVILKGGFKMTRAAALANIAVGFVGYGLSLGFQFLGTKLSTASTAALVTSTTPALVLPFAALILREKITPRKLSALVIASIGVLLVIAPWSNGSGGAEARSGQSALWGNMLLIAAAATWALYSVLVRRVAGNADVLASSAVMFLGGLPTSVVFGLFQVHAIGMGPITVGIVGGVLFLGLISTALAMWLWNWAFAKLPASTASLTFFAQPLVGTLLGWAFLGEQLTLLFLLGGIFIVGSLVIARE